MLRIGATSGSLSSAALTSALGEAWYMFPFALRRAIISPMQRASTPMSISTRLKSFLDETQIPYSVITHTTAYTAQGAAATMQISGKELAKTVVLWTGLSPPFYAWGNKAGARLRRWGCYLGLLGESGYSPLGVIRSRTQAF